VLICFQHLESRFHELLASRFSIIWRILSKNSPPTSPADGWYWCFAVLDAFMAQGVWGDDPSIEDGISAVAPERWHFGT
jgi:hypothetical protein